MLPAGPSCPQAPHPLNKCRSRGGNTLLNPALPPGCHPQTQTGRRSRKGSEQQASAGGLPGKCRSTAAPLAGHAGAAGAWHPLSGAVWGLTGAVGGIQIILWGSRLGWGHDGGTAGAVHCLSSPSFLPFQDSRLLGAVARPALPAPLLLLFLPFFLHGACFYPKGRRPEPQPRKALISGHLVPAPSLPQWRLLPPPIRGCPNPGVSVLAVANEAGLAAGERHGVGI